MARVPTIDLTRIDGTSREALDEACRDHGFFLLAGHGADDLIGRTWDATTRFFARPHPEKQTVRRSEGNALGYYDRELTKQKRDCKEVFDFMDPDGPIGVKRNRWPSDTPEFRSTLTEFFRVFSALAAATVRVVHDALTLSGDDVQRHGGSHHISTVRLNHYPVGDPVPQGQRADLSPLGEVALGHHTDPGVLTLLLQDDTGGLQTLSKADGWIDVPPEPGTIVVNLGDVMQVWTNDRYRAAVHRVVPMTRRARYSIPYFYNPVIDSVISPIEVLRDGPPHYRDFTWREFMQARIDDNYADLGTEDTQVDHYRVA
jgi:isopenicillin N synthase-like dioxygenase